MKYMLVKDFMTKDLICVDRDVHITEIAKVLKEKKIHAVPVVKENKIIGIVSETDFFTKDSNKIYLPMYVEFLRKSKKDGNLLTTKSDEIDELIGACAKDIMTCDPITINENAEVEDLIKLIKEKRLHTVPVVNDQNELAGIVALSDLMQIIS